MELLITRRTTGLFSGLSRSRTRGTTEAGPPSDEAAAEERAAKRELAATERAAKRELAATERAAKRAEIAQETTPGERAAELVATAQERAAELVAVSGERAAELVAAAEPAVPGERAAELVAAAEKRATELVIASEERATGLVTAAEERAAELVIASEERAAERVAGAERAVAAEEQAAERVAGAERAVAIELEAAAQKRVTERALVAERTVAAEKRAAELVVAAERAVAAELVAAAEEAASELVAAAEERASDLVSAAEVRVAERAAAAELVTQAEERAQAFVRSNAELEQFAFAASHDLQEPLRKIRMFGDKLQVTLGEGLSEEAAASLERMLNAAERMQQLINDLLDFSRVGHKGQKFEPVDLGSITKDVIADLEARIVELSARVEVDSLPTIDADQTQMRQLMQNLISNALKFHREGEPPIISVSGRIVAGHSSHPSENAREGGVCVITVQDNGIGFAEKDSERVFTAFERLHGHSAYEGTGIGLAIVRKIVSRHGGHISASGTEGQGATFTVVLPISHDGTLTDGGVS